MRFDENWAFRSRPFGLPHLLSHSTHINQSINQSRRRSLIITSTSLPSIPHPHTPPHTHIDHILHILHILITAPHHGYHQPKRCSWSVYRLNRAQHQLTSTDRVPAPFSYQSATYHSKLIVHCSRLGLVLLVLMLLVQSHRSHSHSDMTEEQLAHVMSEAGPVAKTKSVVARVHSLQIACGRTLMYPTSSFSLSIEWLHPTDLRFTPILAEPKVMAS